MSLKVLILVISILIPFKIFADTNIQDTDIPEIKLILEIPEYRILKEFHTHSKKNDFIAAENRRYTSANILVNKKLFPARIKMDGLGIEHFNSNSMNKVTYRVKLKQDNYLYNLKDFRIIARDAVGDNIPLRFNKLSKIFSIPFVSYRKTNMKIKLTPYQIIYPNIPGTLYDIEDFEIENIESLPQFTHYIEERVDDIFLDKFYLREGILFKRNIFSKNNYSYLKNCRKRQSIIDIVNMLERGDSIENIISKRNLFFEYFTNSKIIPVQLISREKLLNQNAEFLIKFSEDFCVKSEKNAILSAKLKQINKFNNDKQKNYAFKNFNDYYSGKLEPKKVFDFNQVVPLFIMHSIWNNGHSLQDHNVKFYFNPISNLISVIPTDPAKSIKSKKVYLNTLAQIVSENDIDAQSYNELILPFKVPEWEFASTIKGNFYYNNNSKNWFDNLVNDKKFQLEYFLTIKKILNNKDFESSIMNLMPTASFIEIKNNYSVFAQSYFDDDGTDRQTKLFRPLVNNKIKKLQEEIKLTANDDLHKIFIINHNKKIINFKNLNTYIDENITISKKYSDYTLFINDNANIYFKNDSSLIINSNFSCNEYKNIEKSKEINFISKSNSSYILFKGNYTYLNKCIFEDFNISNPKMFLTSPITFFKTNLEIINSSFKNFIGEDMINIVNTEFKIDDSKFENSTSDMIDFDRSNGTIINIHLSNCGNDCIDFSGSNVEINGLNIDGSNDKSISIGEESNLTINNATLNNCSNICIAVKDSSTLRLSNSQMTNGKIGISSYIKKKMYNEPKYSYENVKFNQINQDLENLINTN